jgi:hypothetical protein
MSNAKTQSLVIAVLAAILAFGWQALTVHFNYGGNWTALFCTGEKLSVPPPLETEGIYRFPGAIGYDGQFYHYMAHDPFLRRSFADYVDAPRLRYRRPLVPVAAHLLALGQDRFVDSALLAVIWITVLLGAYWTARLAALDGWHPAWGLAFLAVPAVIVAIDRTVVDATLAALTAGFVLYARRGPPWKLYVILVCAALTRETGWRLAAAYAIFIAAERAWARAAVFATSVLPSMGWTWWITGKVSGDLGALPPGGLRYVLLHPQALVPARYENLGERLATALTVLDHLMLASVILAILLAIWLLGRKPRPAVAFAAAAFAALMAVTLILVTQGDAYTWARLSSPLLVLLALAGMQRERVVYSAPLLLVTLRTAAQLAPQLQGVLRGLLRG